MKNLIKKFVSFFYQNENSVKVEAASNQIAEEECFHCYAEEPYVFYLRELCK